MNWNFELLYKDNEAYTKDLQQVKNNITLYHNYQGKLNNSKTLFEFMQFQDTTEKMIVKLFNYARMKFDLDQKNTKALEEYQIVYGVYNDLVEASSFVSSELISVGKEKLLEFMEENPGLIQYRFNMEKLFHNQSHILSADKELLLSYYNAPLSAFNDLYDKLAVSDNQSEMVTLSTGETVEVSNANFRGYLATLKNQEDRQKVFESVYKFYDGHKNTFAAIYKGVIESNIATMKARGYDSILSSFLEHNNIPNDVFMNLVNTCHENTEPLKKYYQLRKKFFGLETLHTYDRFLELSQYTKKYTYEEAKNLFFESVKSIGGDFEKKAHEVVADGRVDVEIKPAKTTGAYSGGTYDEGPFILLNFNETLDDVFTLAHEAGHSIHTMYSNENQPYCTADYVIFVAEVASTFNEQLLLDYLLKKSDDRNLKIVILQNAIDGLIATFYRQTLFADYEYQAHNLGVNGEAITCDSLSNIMVNLYKEYYDIDLNKEPYKQFVWCYIPHLFHTPFYVYQYATSFASSLMLYSKVKNQEPNALENYLTLLKSGGSDYPVQLLQKAGIDLTNKDSFTPVINRISDLVDQLEALLKEE